MCAMLEHDGLSGGGATLSPPSSAPPQQSMGREEPNGTESRPLLPEQKVCVIDETRSMLQLLLLTNPRIGAARPSQHTRVSETLTVRKIVGEVLALRAPKTPRIVLPQLFLNLVLILHPLRHPPNLPIKCPSLIRVGLATLR